MINNIKKEEPLTREQLRTMRPSPKNVYFCQKNYLTRTQRFASWITEKIGTMGFFYVLMGWTIIWLGWNMIAPAGMRFDPFPGFILWLFISNMIQLVLMPIIMIGQNLQGYRSDARAEADFELNMMAEKEIDTVLVHLENQNEIMIKILEKLEDRLCEKCEKKMSDSK